MFLKRVAQPPFLLLKGWGRKIILAFIKISLIIVLALDGIEC